MPIRGKTACSPEVSVSIFELSEFEIRGKRERVKGGISVEKYMVGLSVVVTSYR